MELSIFVIEPCISETPSFFLTAARSYCLQPAEKVAGPVAALLRCSVFSRRSVLTSRQTLFDCC
jgi:hypothetical protein